MRLVLRYVDHKWVLLESWSVQLVSCRLAGCTEGEARNGGLGRKSWVKRQPGLSSTNNFFHVHLITKAKFWSAPGLSGIDNEQQVNTRAEGPMNGGQGQPTAGK